MKTTKRHEYKYLISYADYFFIKEKIKALLDHDKHGNMDDYPVHSVYLDDLVHSGASDKAFGNEIHKKYRIRYYHEQENFKLERKYKIGEVSEKTSSLISKEVFQAILNQDTHVLYDYISDPLIASFILDTSRNPLSPTMFIKYQREAYKDQTDNLRITFDHSLETDLFSSTENTNYLLPVLPSNQLILEVKYEHFLPKEVKTILRQIPMTHVAYSKYFMAFNHFQF